MTDATKRVTDIEDLKVPLNLTEEWIDTYAKDKNAIRLYEGMCSYMRNIKASDEQITIFAGCRNIACAECVCDATNIRNFVKQTLDK